MAMANSSVFRFGVEQLLVMLYPMAPHFASEAYEQINPTLDVADCRWPVANESDLVEDNFNLVLQVNGKMRKVISVPSALRGEHAKLEQLALSELKGDIGEVRTVIQPKGRQVVNIVTK
jgi:leucyl-tRNA synthetase